MENREGQRGQQEEITLQQFMDGTRPTLAAFQAATQACIDKGEKDFYGTRTEVDWWREVAAYVHYVEAQELAAHFGLNIDNITGEES